MSDFGSLLLFQRSNGDLTSEDLENIKSILKEVVTEGEFPSNITGGNFLDLRQWDSNVYCSLITEYYLDIESDDLKEYFLKYDIEDCEKIVKKLKPLLPEIKVEARFEDW